MSVNSKMTAIADKIRTLLGISGTLGLDAMSANLDTAVTACDTQADLIAEIKAALEGKAAGGGVSIEALDFTDPEVVYQATRPKDWLPMPVPGDDEIYLLNLIPEGVDGAFTALLNFTGSCSVEIGNLVDGVFVAKESITPTKNVRFYQTVRWEDYADTTADGYRQYIVCIKGTFTQALLYPENDTVFSYGQPMVVDAVSGRGGDIRFGNSTTDRANCSFLRYARFVGNDPLSNGSFAFRHCRSLKSVYSESEKENSYVSANYAFDGCSALIAVSDAFFSANATYTNVFKDSTFIPCLKRNIKVTDATAMFQTNLNNGSIDFMHIDTSQCALFGNFANGAKLTSVKNLDISSASNIGNIFLNVNLYELTFAGETTPGGWTIALTSCKMKHEQLVNMINSLPTALSPATITITGNPGASELTDAEIAVATAKNWTVTI